MSTTKHLQRKPDFYQNQEECKLHTRNRINRSLELLKNKELSNPLKKHGNIPL